MYNILGGVIPIKLQPTNFNLEITTMWSSPDRGSWATHSGSYRGNWSPYVPRNLILRYSKPDEWVLDQFVGSGTTLVEAKLLGRNAIGIDINESSVLLSKDNLNFDCDVSNKIIVICGDARNLSYLKNESIDFICTHPPYADIIKYSVDNKDDISLLDSNRFIIEMQKVAQESYRVLKKGKVCAIMMGDIRKDGYIVPVGFKTMECFLNTGFKSKEVIIKKQHNCTSSKYWKKQYYTFLLLAHEYIFVFEK